jgi:hypothetical protein
VTPQFLTRPVVSWLVVAGVFSVPLMLLGLGGQPTDVCAPVTNAEDHRQCVAGLAPRQPAPSSEWVQQSDGSYKLREPQRPQSRVTQEMRDAARRMILGRGYDCQTVDQMDPYIFSEGATVYCNAFRYRFELANHGGIWSVTAP